MHHELLAFEGAAAGLIAAGQPFALAAARVAGVEYRSDARMPANKAARKIQR